LDTYLLAFPCVFLVPPLLVSFESTQVGVLATAAGEERDDDYECCAPVFVASPCLILLFILYSLSLLLEYISESGKVGAVGCLSVCLLLSFCVLLCESPVIVFLSVGLGGSLRRRCKAYGL
jgi:hypothetical protein